MHAANFNPCKPNGFSHYYQIHQSSCKVVFFVFIIEIIIELSVCTVCLCPIKKTLGLNWVKTLYTQAIGTMLQL